MSGMKVQSNGARGESGGAGLSLSLSKQPYLKETQLTSSSSFFLPKESEY